MSNAGKKLSSRTERRIRLNLAKQQSLHLRTDDHDYPSSSPIKRAKTSGTCETGEDHYLVGSQTDSGDSSCSVHDSEELSGDDLSTSTEAGSETATEESLSLVN